MKEILNRLHNAYNNISTYSVADIKDLLKDAANALSEAECLYLGCDNF